jgi:CubicO group peptidase (beta-lactamase class C family)
MHRTTVFRDGAPIVERAIGYECDSSKQTFRKQDADEGIFFSTEGDGGIYTSISDYALWWQFLQDTTKKRYKNVIEAVRSPHLAVKPETKLFYGYGWFVSNLDTARVVYHTGSNGGFRAIVFSIPSQNYIVAIFSNRTGIDLEKLVQQINDIMGVTNNSFTKIDGLVSFINSWPIFAPCKKIPWFSISYKRNSNVNVMA